MAQVFAAAVGRNLNEAPPEMSRSVGRGSHWQPPAELGRELETCPDGDVNFASIMDLDTSGGWQVVRLGTDGKLLAAEPSATKVLQQFFPGEAVGEGQMPGVLADQFIERRNWGLSQVLRVQCGRTTAIRDGLQLTVHFIPELGGGYLLLKIERQRPATAYASTLSLTGREREVVALVAMGKTNIEIGIVLKISSRTVQKHLENIFQKLGVETRTAVAVRALALVPNSDFQGIEDLR